MIDAATLTEIWDENADRLLLIARAFGGPAEDAVQEAFVTLARQPELPADPMAWLVRVTRNHLLQWHRGNRRRRILETAVGRHSWFDREILSVERRLDGHEVTAALMAMGSPQREIIVMRLWGDMTFESIADVIGLSRASVHRRFTSGMETLKEQFDRESNADSRRLCHE